MGKSPWGLPYPPTILKPKPSGPRSSVIDLHWGGLQQMEGKKGFSDFQDQICKLWIIWHPPRTRKILCATDEYIAGILGMLKLSVHAGLSILNLHNLPKSYLTHPNSISHLKFPYTNMFMTWSPCMHAHSFSHLFKGRWLKVQRTIVEKA